MRRSDEPPAPTPNADGVRYYADEDGALRSLLADGTDAPVAGAGSLPNPTDEGDVLTVVSGEWAGAPGGGSMPVSLFSGADAPTAPVNTYFQVAPTGAPNTSGTFKLAFRGETTAPIAFDATNDDVAAALALLSTIGAGNIVPYPYSGGDVATVNDTVYPVFAGIFLGEAVETPTVTDDTTDNGVTASDGAPGTAGVPAEAVNGDLYAKTDVDGAVAPLYSLAAGSLAIPEWVAVSSSLPFVVPIGGSLNPFLKTAEDDVSRIIVYNRHPQANGFDFDLYSGGIRVWATSLNNDNETWLLTFKHPNPPDPTLPDMWGIKQTGHEAISASPGEPADSVALKSERVQWYDDTNGAPAMRYKQRTADNTLHTGISLASEGSQDTVGAAGGASALPATPSKYIKVTDEEGNHYVIPAYAAS